MLKVRRFDEDLFSESIQRYIIKDIYPAVTELFPEIKQHELKIDIEEVECTTRSDIDPFDDCIMLKLGSNCRIVSSILQQSSFTNEIGFVDYYKTTNPHLYICDMKGNFGDIHGAWILDLTEPFILYFSFTED